MALLTDSRLFLAHELLDRLEGFLMRNPDLQVTKDLKRELEMSQNQKRIKQLHQRVQMLRSAIQDFDMVMLAFISLCEQKKNGTTN